MLEYENFDVFREVLHSLKYCGMSIQAFARKIKVSPQTLYNYINGQRPSIHAMKYILYQMEKECPKALQMGIEISRSFS